VSGISVCTEEKPSHADTIPPCPDRWENFVSCTGRVKLEINNTGGYGNLVLRYIPESMPRRLVYKNGASDTVEYMSGACYWMGAKIDGEMLVSAGDSRNKEFYPDTTEVVRIKFISNDSTNPNFDPSAKAPCEYRAAFTDTFMACVPTIDSTDNRPHKPLGIKVKQYVYSFAPDSSIYADFLIFRLVITNIGNKLLQDAYLGIYHNGYCGFLGFSGAGSDDLTGFLAEALTPGSDTVKNLAWVADNDGDPEFLVCDTACSTYVTPMRYRVNGVTGLKLLGSSKILPNFSYNWWFDDLKNGDSLILKNWGPVTLADFTQNGHFPDSSLGTPSGDEAKYRIMANREIDYNQATTYLDHTSEGFLPPPVWPTIDSLAYYISTGFYSLFLSSFGKFDLAPQDSISLDFAVIMGDNFHGADSLNWYSFNWQHPDSSYSDFSNLVQNTKYAQSLYDSIFDVGTDVKDGKKSPFPRSFSLSQNYPNPFNSSTKIAFTLQRSGSVTLEIYNLLGEKVATLIDKFLAAGSHALTWDGKNESGEIVASGIYFYRLSSEGNSLVKKMVLLK